VLRLIEQRLIFKPTREDHGGLDAIPHERIRFGREFGLDLDGAFVHNGSSSVALFLHGNRHNITRFRDHYDLFTHIGQSFFTFDYPGYGQSHGTPSEGAAYAAARAAYALIRAKMNTPADKIIVYGCSMGGAVAMELCQNAQVAGLITEATFTNSREMAQHLYPYLPLWPFLPNRFRNDLKISQINAPIMLIHGNRDPIVPASMASQLLKASEGRAKLVIIEDADHISCIPRSNGELEKKIHEFILQHTARA
jgi:fermentation-respiration switch protein FrsA (DUF1100 family)